MNKKHRVIMMTAEGKYVVKTDKGMAYNPKAAYVKSPGGSVRTLANSDARVPTAIRPKMVRKRRTNAGKARGAYAGVKAGALPMLFATPKKMMSPMWNLPNPLGKGLRKVRKNKGMKRGPRKMLYKVKLGGQYVA
jgi:hypothetical protein